MNKTIQNKKGLVEHVRHVTDQCGIKWKSNIITCDTFGKENTIRQFIASSK